MIFGNINFVGSYDFLEDKIKKCFEYAAKNDLNGYELGSYEIDGENIFVNIVSYETKNPQERFWEAHKKYIDLHFMLSGEEQIDLNFIKNMEQKEFVPKDDFLPLEGEPNSHVALSKGDFLICYPEDGHRTGVKTQCMSVIKKAIFKIIV